MGTGTGTGAEAEAEAGMGASRGMSTGSMGSSVPGKASGGTGTTWCSVGFLVYGILSLLAFFLLLWISRGDWAVEGRAWEREGEGIMVPCI